MEEYVKEQQNCTEICPIQVSKIVPNPNQPRKCFAEESIIKLADSIRQFGIIQPISVRKSGDYYELIAGERRLRAAKELGMTSVPCIIVNINEEKSAEISIVENLLREDLNIFEQAIAIETLIDTYGLTQEKVAQKLSNSQSFVANKLRLLRLNEKERQIILNNKLSERHARTLLRIYDEELRQEILDKIVSEGLTVSKTEELIENILAPKQQKQEKSAASYKDIGSFYNAINRALDVAKNSNLMIKSRKIVGESFTELTIIIPNKIESESKSNVEDINYKEQLLSIT